ncbi:hypothetical protein Thiosp_00722 [Thiorhodovibrio litoralis]|nr:hypothetical protein Thiosp_00722 [Thiorhodovibrio litoralis]
MRILPVHVTNHLATKRRHAEFLSCARKPVVTRVWALMPRFSLPCFLFHSSRFFTRPILALFARTGLERRHGRCALPDRGTWPEVLCFACTKLPLNRSEVAV